MNDIKKSSGIGLLELMLVLTIIAAILLMATRYYQEATENLKVSKSVQLAKKITEASFEWAKGKGSLDGVNLVTELINAGFLAQSDFVNAWGGDITVTGARITSPCTYDRIVIKFANVPKKSCVNLNDVLTKENFEDFPSCLSASNVVYIGIFPKPPC